MASDANSLLLDSLAKCYRSGTHHDLIISTLGDDHRVHKMIVGTRSKVLANACEGASDSRHTCTIKLPDEDDRAVKSMIDYLYLLDYDIDTAAETPSSSPRLPQHHDDASWRLAAGKALHHQSGFDRSSPADDDTQSKVTSHMLHHAKVYCLALKFEVQGLDELALAKFVRSMDGDWDREQFPLAAEYVWANSHGKNMLRTNILQMIWTRNEELLHCARYQEVIQQCHALAYDTLMFFMKQETYLSGPGVID